MKVYNLFLRTLFVMSMLFMSLVINGKAIRSCDGGIVIVLEQDPLEVDDMPRSPGSCPFFAEYQNGNVSLNSLDSIGTVVVEISSTAGDDYCTYFDTSDGSILLPVSGDPGYYLLRITVSSNVHYNGRFEL